MEMICEESYPALRVHLYDGSKIYSAPFTVFGKIRAAIYIGEAYLVVTTTEQVKEFVKRFDNLVRKSLVGPDVVHKTFAKLADDVHY